MGEPSDSAKQRGYTMRARQESVERTQLRITEATVRLHEQVGPAATTVSAIAERAGVTRLTVYRHFPDNEALINACSAHWRARHPRPDPARWAAIRDPVQRLRAALLDTYQWAGPAAPMMTKIYRDLDAMPTFVGDSLVGDEQARVAILADGFPAHGRSSARLRAAIAHALHFRTWQSLCDVGELHAEEAVEIMVAAVVAAVHTPDRAPNGRRHPARPERRM